MYFFPNTNKLLTQQVTIASSTTLSSSGRAAQAIRQLVWAALLLFASAATAQTPAVTEDSALPGLLAERKVLTRRYAEASAQRHSLFGNKPSKKDLQEVVDALQEIVDKDQQIVDVLNKTAQQAKSTSVRLAATTTHLETSSRGDRNLTAQRLYEVQNELNNLKVRERKQAARIRDLEHDLSEAEQGRLLRDGLVAGLGLLSVALLFFRVRNSNSPVRNTKVERPGSRRS